MLHFVFYEQKLSSAERSSEALVVSVFIGVSVGNGINTEFAE